jgi:hypothetical protein
MTQLVAAPGAQRELRRWCLEEIGARLATSAEMQHFIVNVAKANPLPELYPGESLEGDEFDVVLQSWASSLAIWEKAFRPFEGELSALSAKRFDYRISERTIRHESALLRPGRPTPGYKLMRGLVFHADLGAAAARRQWLHHADLAVRVHLGVARYTQHWVEERLSAEAPAIGGFSELHFPSLEAMRDRYFDSQRGRQEIIHDTGHFIASGSKRFYGEEQVFK